MNTPRRILFAVKDPASRRHAVIDKVARIAKSLDAQLELFNAISTPVFLEIQPLSGTSLAELRREALTLRKRQLEKLAARARKLGVETHVAVEWDFPPHEAIVRRARAFRADLVVAECHRGRRLKPWLLHLTDWEVLRESPVPVLLIKNFRTWRRRAVLAAVDPSHAHAKPLRLDDTIVAHAQALARKTRGRFELMHANFPLGFGFVIGEPGLDPALLAASHEVQLDHGKKLFVEFADRRKIPRARRHLREEHPAQAIPGLARRLGADLVVMGAVARSGLKRMFIGNTAERVLDDLPCDVLVVKPAHVEHPVTHKPRGMRVVAPSPILPLPA